MITFGSSILSITMLQSRYIWMLAIYIICTYCRKDFQSLGRHSWHCKEKVNTCRPKQAINVIQESDSQSSVDTQLLQCIYGKEYKGVKGFKMHQRLCRVIEDMIHNQPVRIGNLEY